MRRPLRMVLTVGCLAGLVLVGGCGGVSAGQVGRSAGDNGRIAVVTSTNVWGDVVRQVGGDRVQVTALINDPSQDPHSFEPSGRDELALSRAALIVENGGGYDDFMQIMIDAVEPAATVITAVDAAAPAITSAGDRGDAAGELNEHVWFDLAAVADVASAVQKALSRADPAGAQVYRANLDRFRDKLAKLEQAVAELKSHHAGAPVAVTEPLPDYLLAAAGLVDRTPAEFKEALEEDNDVPPSVVEATLNLVRQRQVDALVYNAQTASPQAEQLRRAADDSGIPVVAVTETIPAGQDYLEWMRGTIAALATALEGANR